MAITKESSPLPYTPSDNPITWTFSSDKTGEENFSYIIDVSIDAVLISTHQVFPENGIYAHFDAMPIAIANTPVAKLTTGIVSDSSNVIEMTILVSESYGSTPTLHDDFTETVNVFKACLSQREFIDWDYENYLVGELYCAFMTDFCISESYSLTSKNNIINARTTDDIFLQIINNNNASDLVIEYYDSDNVLLYDESIAISNTIKIVQLNLNTTLLVDMPVGTSYFLASVQLGTTSTSMKISLIEEDACLTYTQLTWLNKFGSFDQFVFNHNKTQSSFIKPFNYEKQFGSWVDNEFVYSENNSGTQGYLKTIEDVGEISSGWLSESVQNLVVQVYESPYVVIKNTVGTHYYFQVEITNSSYEIKQIEYQDLFNEIVKYKKSNTRKSITL